MDYRRIRKGRYAGAADSRGLDDMDYIELRYIFEVLTGLIVVAVIAVVVIVAAMAVWDWVWVHRKTWNQQPEFDGFQTELEDFGED